MAGRRQNKLHTYTANQIQQLKSINLPQRLKCGRCLKFLAQQRFSQKQLTDARLQVSDNGRIDKLINCMSCTGQRVVEIQCTMCLKTKGLEEFAKSQRKPDTAKCFDCVDEQVNRPPPGAESRDNAFAPPDTSGGSAPDYNAAPASSDEQHDWSTFTGSGRTTKGSEDGGVALSRPYEQGMAMGIAMTDTLIGSEYSYVASQNAAGSAHGTGNTSWHTQSSAVTPSTGVSEMSSNRHSRPSASSSTAERPDVRSNGWAKIRAAPRPQGVEVKSPFVRSSGDEHHEIEDDVWASDDDERDDDDDDSDGDNTII